MHNILTIKSNKKSFLQPNNIYWIKIRLQLSPNLKMISLKTNNFKSKNGVNFKIHF